MCSGGVSILLVAFGDRGSNARMGAQTAAPAARERPSPLHARRRIDPGYLPAAGIHTSLNGLELPLRRGPGRCGTGRA